MLAISVVGWKFGEAIKVNTNREVDDETITRWNNAARKSREAVAISKVAGEQ